MIFFQFENRKNFKEGFLSIWMIHQESKKTLVAAFSLCL